jgi:hypothetical protein
MAKSLSEGSGLIWVRLAGLSELASSASLGQSP